MGSAFIVHLDNNQIGKDLHSIRDFLSIDPFQGIFAKQNDRSRPKFSSLFQIGTYNWFVASKSFFVIRFFGKVFDGSKIIDCIHYQE